MDFWADGQETSCSRSALSERASVQETGRLAVVGAASGLHNGGSNSLARLNRLDQSAVSDLTSLRGLTQFSFAPFAPQQSLEMYSPRRRIWLPLASTRQTLSPTKATGADRSSVSLRCDGRHAESSRAASRADVARVSTSARTRSVRSRRNAWPGAAVAARALFRRPPDGGTQRTGAVRVGELEMRRHESSAPTWR
jgi:hypothetical protein